MRLSQGIPVKLVNPQARDQKTHRANIYENEKV